MRKKNKIVPVLLTGSLFMGLVSASHSAETFGLAGATAVEAVETTTFTGLREKLIDIFTKVRSNIDNGEKILSTGSYVSEDQYNVGTIAGISESWILYDFFPVMKPMASFPNGPVMFLHLDASDSNAEAANARCILTAVESANLLQDDLTDTVKNFHVTCTLDEDLPAVSADCGVGGDGLANAQESDVLTIALSDELSGEEGATQVEMVNKCRSNLSTLNAYYTSQSRPLHSAGGIYWWQIGYENFDKAAVENNPQ